MKAILLSSLKELGCIVLAVLAYNLAVYLLPKLLVYAAIAVLYLGSKYLTYRAAKASVSEPLQSPR